MTDPSLVNERASGIGKIWIRNEDDWSGVSDPTARRRIQNRQNQRTLRLKRRERRELGTAAVATDTPLAPSSLISIQQDTSNLDFRTIADAIKTVNILDLKSETGRMIMRDFEALACSYYTARAPAITLRPILSQFNFIRALWANVEVLELSSSQMSDDDEPSPFNSSEPSRAEMSTALEVRLPVGLRPTPIQRATLHHPWIDLIPIPEMRDNLFRHGLDSFDEEELCHDMRGRAHQDPGVLVWHDPWDPSSWEVTESFVQSWGWAIAGCWELFESTNKWRAQRGEKPLFRAHSVRQ